ncbi:MAG: tetratricopeptide repeat protein [Polaribacter sp.]
MEFHFYKKYLLFLVYLSTTFLGFSQESIADASILTDYNDALKLYNNKAYAAAQKTFLKVSETAANSSNLKADASYFDAMCAIKLNQTEADKKVLTFVEENPNSNKKNKAYFNVGNYYFANQKAAHALKWYKKVDVDILSKENRKELNFKMGYGLLSTNNLSLARSRFLPLINDAKYGNDARYYYGFIAYKLEDYGIAESTLKEIADNKSYSAEISYYLLDISFKAGKFQRCIDVGKKLIQTSKRKEQSEISKIIGESYFNLEKYNEAIPYLRDYRGKKGRWNNTDYYQLGYAYYQQNDFENAVNNFNKIIDQKNNVSQNAYYHLGECYLNLEKKAEALNAFKTASEMDFNTSIKEDAALNYAKLSYEQGNPFKSVAEVLQDFLKAYPKSKFYNEINKLVVTSFIHQQDYQGALDYLAKKKSKENTDLTLEVSLYRGIQLFNEKKLEKSLSYFAKSKKSNDLKIKQKSQYWEAETNYRLENYKDGLAKFINLKKNINTNESEFSLIDYNIGYSYFKLKEYENASKYFVNFLKNNEIENELKDDASIRLGDSYFATRNYKKSVNSYKKVVDEFGAGADYAQYQIAMSYGFTGDNNTKIIALKKVVNDFEISSLKDDALYQLGNTYTTLKDHKQAHQAYNRLLEKHPKSVFFPKTLVRQGLLFYNDNQNEKALEKFKQVTRQFPNGPDALEAVANARNIYIDNGNTDDYVAWVKTLKFVNVSNSDLDNTAFAAAERKYFESKNTREIIKSLSNYTKSFPEGIHTLKVNYYLAESLYKDKQFDKAIAPYKIVLNSEQNEFSEESLNKLSQIYLSKEDFTNALPLLHRLEQEAYTPENILYAQSNLMKGYYETEAYNLAIEYAKKVLLKDKLDSAVEYDAKTIIARASFKTDDLPTAEEFYTEVERNATGELKAEALYYSAFFKNQNKEFDASNKIVQKLIADYSAYKYWGVKSYVTMAKNYYGLKDAYQATYILENVISNFKQFEDIIAEAKIELDKIKQNEAKTNTSVTPEKKEISKKETEN